jgi:hypothetical protein
MRMLTVVALTIAMLAGATRAAETPALRAIAVAGQPAPGGGMFDRFGVESQPMVAPVNARGQVAFFSTLVRARTDEALFLASGRGINRVAAEGDAAPGGGTFSGFGRHPVPALNASGDVAFAAAVSGGRTVEGVFVSVRGKLRAVVTTGAAAPGVASATFASVDSPALNDRGDIAFLATLRRGRETVEAIYLSRGGRLQKVVTQGDPAPAGGTFAGFSVPAINAKGLVAFGAVIEGRAVPGGLFVAEGDRVRMLVGAGDDAPGGGIFAKFSDRLALNDAGTLAFNAILAHGPIAGGLFAFEGDRTRPIVVLGDAAPGGGRFSYFGLWPTLTATGDVAFAASVDGGSTPIGVFLAGRDGITRIAGVGDLLPSGGTLASFGLYPVATTGPNGGLTFATAATATGEGVTGIYAVPPRGPR